MFKKGDILMCVEPDPAGQLELGEVYEAMEDQTRLDGVRVAQKEICCSEHPWWVVKPWFDIRCHLAWRANRFQKVGSLR